MRFSKYLCVALCLICCLTGEGQNDDASSSVDSVSTWDLLKHDTKSTWKSVKYSVTRPLDWKGKDFQTLGILLGGTATLSLLDEEANAFFTRQDARAPKLAKDFGWYFGSPQNYFVVNAGLYGFGLLTENEKIRKTSVLIISSSITSGFIQSFSKTAIGRARPGGDYGAFEFRPFSKEGAFHSFPSGHTMLSMTMAHAIAKQFDGTFSKIVVYAIGAIPPISRLSIGAHWLTDVVFSTAISIIVVDSIDKFLNQTNAYRYDKDKQKISWNLAFSPNQIGLIGRF